MQDENNENNQDKLPLIISDGKILFISEYGEDYLTEIEELKTKQAFYGRWALFFMSLGVILGLVCVAQVFVSFLSGWQTIVVGLASIVSGIAWLACISEKDSSIHARKEKEKNINLIKQEHQQDLMTLEKALAHHKNELATIQFQNKLDAVCNIPQSAMTNTLFKK